MPFFHSLSIKPAISLRNILVSILFGLVCFMTPIFSPTPKNHPFIWGVVGCAVFILIIYILTCVQQHSSNLSSKRVFSDTSLFLVTFISSLLISFLYLIIYYPGTGSTDTLYIYYGGFAVAFQHPWPYILLINLIEATTRFLGGSQESAIFAFSLFQICLAALVFSYCLVWLRNKHLRTPFLVVIGCFYTICPIICLYNITQVKDVPYSLIQTLLIPILYDCWESHGKSLTNWKSLLFLSLCTVASVLRNNGPYVIAFLLIYLFLFFRKYYKPLILVLLVFLASISIVKLGEKHLNQEHYFRETVGIPLQQIAATVYYDGNITPAQNQVINKIMPVEAIKELYDPYSVDTLKFGEISVNNEYLNHNKSEFLKTWAEMLIPNFKIYVKSYLYALYGFWSVDNTPNVLKYDTIYRDSFSEWFIQNNISYKSVLPTRLQSLIESFLDKITVFCGVGTCFWLFIVLTCVLLTVKQSKSVIIICIPTISYWITLMISSPIAYQWRYGLPIVYALPLLFGIIFAKSHTINS